MSAKRITGGRLFQHRIPAAEKARSPKCVFILRTPWSVLSNDRSHSPNEEEWVTVQCSNRANTLEQLHAVIESRVNRACTRYGMGLAARGEHYGGAAWPYCLLCRWTSPQHWAPTGVRPGGEQAVAAVHLISSRWDGAREGNSRLSTQHGTPWTGQTPAGHMSRAVSRPHIDSANGTI